MARPQKPKYEYVEKSGLYRKRIKDINGKYVAVYGKTPDELTDKIEAFHEAQKNGIETKDNRHPAQGLMQGHLRSMT